MDRLETKGIGAPVAYPKGARVGDHPSEPGELRVRVTPSSRAQNPSLENEAEVAAVEAPDGQPAPFVVQRVAASSLCCAVCGRLGHWWRAGPALRRRGSGARAPTRYLGGGNPPVFPISPRVSVQSTDVRFLPK